MKTFNFLFIVVIGLCAGRRSEVEASIIQKSEGLFPLSIVHLNDFHSKFEQTNKDSTSCKEALGEICIGGFARVMTTVKNLIEQRTNEGKNVVYLNIGDNFVGTLWYELLGQEVVSQFLNILPADATTLGNHEFDRGVMEVVHFLENLKSPVVVANLDDSEEPGLQGKYNKSRIIDRAGRKIGLIGALVVATVDISNPEKLHILDEIESVKKEAQRLKTDEGVDIIIVLSHCGLVIDREMAQQTDDLLDVIVGGHSHTLLYKGSPHPGPDTPADTYPIVYQQPSGHKTLIVQASAYTKYLGDLTVYFDDNGEVDSYEGNPIFMDNSIVPDPEIVEKMLPFKTAVDAIGLRKVGEVKATLYRNDCARDECNIGDFVTDSFIDYIVNHDDFKVNDGWTYATISITNAGGIRTSFVKGDVVFDDLFTVLPFTNTLDIFELLGEDLLKALEMSAEWYTFYNFLQFSGMKVVFNITQPIGQRVVSVDVLCRECDVPKYISLEKTTWYRLIVPSFIGGGGNGFTMFRNKRNNRRTTVLDIEVVEAYFKKMSPVIQKKDGRLIVLR